MLSIDWEDFDIARDLPGHIFAIIGEPGSGKTNLMTAILRENQQDGEKIIANYKLAFPFRLMPFSEMAKFKHTGIRRAKIGMDELGKGADSYDFLSSNNRKITTLTAEIRKFECQVFYTVQRWRWIVKRIRDRTDYFILLQDQDRDTPHKPGKYTCNGLFNVFILNTDLEIQNPFDRGTRKHIPAVFDGKPYRHLYDDKEVIWSDDEIPESEVS